MLQDRGFQGFWLYRKARRRDMLRHFEEEQRSETAESRRKPTGCNMFGALNPSCAQELPHHLAVTHVLARIDAEGTEEGGQQVGRGDGTLAVGEAPDGLGKELVGIRLPEDEVRAEAGRDDQRGVVGVVIATHAEVD